MRTVADLRQCCSEICSMMKDLVTLVKGDDSHLFSPRGSMFAFSYVIVDPPGTESGRKIFQTVRCVRILQGLTVDVKGFEAAIDKEKQTSRDARLKHKAAGGKPMVLEAEQVGRVLWRCACHNNRGGGFQI